MQLHHQNVLITGATSGFGFAAAKLLAQHGARILAAGRRVERLEALKAELKDFPVHTLPLDVREREAVFAAAQNLPKEFAAVDILINNAGLALNLNPLENVPTQELEQMVDTNIKGVIYCTQAFLPGMITRNRGHIINMGSIAGNYPYPGGHVYGGTKAFLKQFSLGLRADLVGKNIRVTNIEPGLAETEFSLVRFQGDKEKADAVYKGVQPLTAEDIAETILWTLSRPTHVNINRIELMPVCQSSGPFAIKRENA